jgi:hypothetical protein
MNEYILIPNKIKTDTKIPSGAKLLYGDILYLSHIEGYCFATNGYFGKMYSVHDNSIRNWINSLKDNNYINVSFSSKMNKTHRKLIPTKNCGGGYKKLWDNPTKICTHINKSYNYKKKINKRKSKVVI